MPDTKLVPCPECRGEGMVRYCAVFACHTCAGSGEVTEAVFNKYQKDKHLTVADLMHPEKPGR